MIKKLAAIYFSGTGNTEYAINRICNQFREAGVECIAVSIEDFNDKDQSVLDCDTVLIAHPIYGSDMPNIMKQFLRTYAALWKGKQLITLVTQLLFSGDGGALAARLFKGQGMRHIASIHINLPSNISDATVFKLKNHEDNKHKIEKANQKINRCATKILRGNQIRNGRHFFSWLFGFFGQRLWYRMLMEKRLSSALKIDCGLCTQCGICVGCCPTKNIEISQSGISTKNCCTACYRCVNICPKKAISLMSKKKPKLQYKGIDRED